MSVNRNETQEQFEARVARYNARSQKQFACDYFDAQGIETKEHYKARLALLATQRMKLAESERKS